MHLENDSLQIMIGSETDNIIKEFFQSLLTRYQIELETLVKGSDLIV